MITNYLNVMNFMHGIELSCFIDIFVCNVSFVVYTLSYYGCGFIDHKVLQVLYAALGNWQFL